MYSLLKITETVNVKSHKKLSSCLTVIADKGRENVMVII